MKHLYVMLIAVLALIQLASSSQSESLNQRVQNFRNKSRENRLHGTTVAGSTDWQWVNPLPQGNDLQSVQSLDANTVIASSGAVIKSTNSGSAWTVIAHPVSGGGIAKM